jgi:hypothetical protein
MFPAEICVGRVGMQLSEDRVHSGVRVHHVCTENAKWDDLASIRSGCEPGQPGVNRRARARFASRSNPL